jgi:feruloyl-CoA synthase
MPVVDVDGGEAVLGAAFRRFSGKFAQPRVDIEHRPSGEIILRSPTSLKPYPERLGSLLDHWAQIAPHHAFLAERCPEAGIWRKLSYSACLGRVRSIAQALLNRGLTAEHPIVIVAENSIDHALMMLGAVYAGIPAVPVSTAYAKLSSDFAKFHQIISIIRPKLLFVDDANRCLGALRAVDLGDAEIVVSTPNIPHGLHATPFETLTGVEATGALDAAAKAVGPETIAKILFTSGSTDPPKGVINTHGMLCANQQMIAQLWLFLSERPPVLVDWLPWSHAFGGNHNFNIVLRHGGTLYIDGGKPVPGSIEKTVAALHEVSPTCYFNVPRGYGLLLDYLEKDSALRDHFFGNLEMIFYAAAALPQSSWARLESLSLAALGEKIPIISSWGLTETAPLATCVHYPIDRAGIIGLPAPGTELKLVPKEGKYEMRVRGPHVTPGYWKRPDITQTAFDEEAFFITGDAGAFVAPDEPSKGIKFDGRLGENFKLSSGTWVRVGELRVAVIAAAAPLIDDVVIAGHDRDEIGLLVFPNIAACRSLAVDLPPQACVKDLLAARPVREAVTDALQKYNTESHAGSSMRIARALLMEEPPSADANEITDKGYINQRAVLRRRADLLEGLYGLPCHADVVELSRAWRA